MSSSPQALPAARGTSPLRVLAAIALLAVTVCAVSVTILAWQAITATRGVKDAAHRVDRSSRDLQPAVRELRRAARAMRQAASAQGVVATP
jgi:signal transduction histidine kinase